MIYAENILLCIAIPMLLCLLFVRGGVRPKHPDGPRVQVPRVERHLRERLAGAEEERLAAPGPVVEDPAKQLGVFEPYGRDAPVGAAEGGRLRFHAPMLPQRPVKFLLFA